MRQYKKAFSIIEIIFILVILGIVSSISSQIIVQVYENYISQKALYTVTKKTELAVMQIANRLTYRIQGTTISKDLNNPGIVRGVNWIRLDEIPANDNNYTTIEWIGYDYSSFTADNNKSLWSGVSDYERASRDSIDTVGSTLSRVDTIIQRVSGGEVGLTGVGVNRPAVIFSQKDKKYINAVGGEYSPECMGMIDNNDRDCIFRVSRNGDSNLTFLNNKAKIATERYKLAWSAYALVPIRKPNGLLDIFLYHNYQPWEGEQYTSVANNRKVLATNVSVFKFTENGGNIQFKLCIRERISAENNITSCKDKAIIQ